MGALGQMLRLLAGWLVLAGLPSAAALAQPADALRVRVISGFAGVRQFERHEVPFWTGRVPAITGGRLLPTVLTFDRAGIDPQHMLSVMRNGVVTFGVIEANAVAMVEPELAAADLPLVAEDLVGLRQAVTAWQPVVTGILNDRYGADMLATFVRPPQVMFCNRAFASLLDLAGRRVRVASVNQSDLVMALGARPLVVPFDRLIEAFHEGRLDCAITGALPGNGIGLHRVTSHISALPLGWAMSFLAAHQGSWAALPGEVQAAMRLGLHELELEMWRAAEEEQALGMACNLGRPPCPPAERGAMVLVPESVASRGAVRALLTAAVLPGWARRCGIACAERWNSTVGPVLGAFARW